MNLPFYKSDGKWKLRRKSKPTAGICRVFGCPNVLLASGNDTTCGRCKAARWRRNSAQKLWFSKMKRKTLQSGRGWSLTFEDVHRICVRDKVFLTCEEGTPRVAEGAFLDRKNTAESFTPKNTVAFASTDPVIVQIVARDGRVPPKVWRRLRA